MPAQEPVRHTRRARLAPAALAAAPAIVMAGGALTSIEEAGGIIAFVLSAGGLSSCAAWSAALGGRLSPPCGLAGEVRRLPSACGGTGQRPEPHNNVVTGSSKICSLNPCHPRRTRMPTPKRPIGNMRSPSRLCGTSPGTLLDSIWLRRRMPSTACAAIVLGCDPWQSLWPCSFCWSAGPWFFWDHNRGF
jgi:hypothetical protein